MDYVANLSKSNDSNNYKRQGRFTVYRNIFYPFNSYKNDIQKWADGCLLNLILLRGLCKFLPSNKLREDEPCAENKRFRVYCPLTVITV